MRSGTRKPRGLKVRRYTDCMIDLNEYLAVLPGARSGDKMCEMELNGVLLNSTLNRGTRQAYEQGFGCEYVTSKKSVNIFERTEIEDYIYEVVVEPSHKKPTRAYANCAGLSRKIKGETSL